MNRQALLMAQRKFKFFPSIAELADFLTAFRPERPTKLQASRELSVAMINSIARQQMREWYPPRGLNWRGQRAWEAWALGIACQSVRDGHLTGRLRQCQQGMEVEITGRLSAPIVPDRLMDEWRALTQSRYEQRDAEPMSRVDSLATADYEALDA